jgi:PIN domain nuclease of toxin-antitoxin system
LKAILLDTHAWAWSPTADARLRPSAAGAVEAADKVLVTADPAFDGVVRRVC